MTFHAHPDPEAGTVANVLAAASLLTAAATGLIDWAASPSELERELRDFAADPNATHPIGEELDLLSLAVSALHLAIGQPATTAALADAAGDFFRGEN